MTQRTWTVALNMIKGKVMTSLVTPTQVYMAHPSGHINASNASHFRAQLEDALLNHSPAVLVVDMSQVESLDSSGLMVLVNILSQAKMQNSKLLLCCLPPCVQMILELTQLDRVFSISNVRPSMQQSPEEWAIAA